MRKLKLILPAVVIILAIFATAISADFYVIPIKGESQGGCTCTGELNGTRWCDNGDGTVTDLTTCLVWLKNANCTETLAEIIKTDGWLDWDDATIWSSGAINGTCGLSDGSTGGEWRLPTKSELIALSSGSEAVSSFSPRAFMGVQSHNYWTSTSLANKTDRAWIVEMQFGNIAGIAKFLRSYVWPVRGGY